MPSNDPLLAPFFLKHLMLRNRVVSTAHAPAYAEDQAPKDRYIRYHEEKAKGGVGLTMIGGSTNVSIDSASVFGQLHAGDDAVMPWFLSLTERVKRHGTAIMCQLTHMGRRTVWDRGPWLPVVGPSVNRERAHRAMAKELDLHEIRRITSDFGTASRRCREAGFDGIELLAHGHLIGQFLSPVINRRTDGYGGDLAARARFLFEVLDAVRESVGADFIVGLRLTGDDRRGNDLDLNSCLDLIDRLETKGGIDFLNIVGGAPYDDWGLVDWVPPMGVPAARYLGLAGEIRAASSLPVLHAGGLGDLATARHAIREGFVDLVGMTRAHIADPYVVSKLTRGEETRIRPCVGLGYCVDRVNQGKDALCGHNVYTGREATLPIYPAPAATSHRVVVVGGGPAGLETARVAALRGHRVTILEAADRLGGQLVLASKGTVRRQVEPALAWLVTEIAHQGVEVRLNTFADATDVLEFGPDVIVLATGGLPNPPSIPGIEWALSTWDLLANPSLMSGDILLFDEIGDQPAAVAADAMSAAGARVEVVSPDAHVFSQLGVTTRAVALKTLYGRRVSFQADHELVAVEPQGNRFRAHMRNILTGDASHRDVDRVVFENGTQPMTDIYEALVDGSINAGSFGLDAIHRDRLTFPKVNAEGRYILARAGDGVSSRNLHAALLDGARLGLSV